MARVNQVLKSRKEQKCSCCGEVIPVGSPYKWISFNFGPTIVRCNSCGFKPYETTANEYSRQVGQLVYEFENNVENAETLEGLEELRDGMVSSLEEVKDELDDKKSNLPEQFQESGPGEILTERIDNLEDVISTLEDVDFDLDDVEEDPSLNEMIDKVKEYEGLDESEVAHLRESEDDYEESEEEFEESEDDYEESEEEFEESEEPEDDPDWTEDRIRESYQEWVDEQKEEKMSSVRESLTDAIGDLNY